MKKEYDFSKMKRVTKPDFSKMKIVSAPRNKMKKFRKEMCALLSLLGHPEAYVTDESIIGDFNPSSRQINQISRTLGFRIDSDMLLINVAARMKLPNTIQ